MVPSIETTGATLDEAIALALRELGVSRDAVEIDVLEEGNGQRPCRVLVSCEAGEDTYYGDTEENFAGDDLTEAEAAAVSLVERVCDNFGLNYHIEYERQDDAFYIDVDSRDCAILIGRGGETLEAIQYLASLAANRKTEELLHVHVDFAGYRRRHEEKLMELAQRTAAQVARVGKTFEMHPMSPADRRIIHSALQDFAGVQTYSEGEGNDRHVLIVPQPEHES